MEKSTSGCTHTQPQANREGGKLECNKTSEAQSLHTLSSSNRVHTHPLPLTKHVLSLLDRKPTMPPPPLPFFRCTYLYIFFYPHAHLVCTSVTFSWEQTRQYASSYALVFMGRLLFNYCWNLSLVCLLDKWAHLWHDIHNFNSRLYSVLYYPLFMQRTQTEEIGTFVYH